MSRVGPAVRTDAGTPVLTPCGIPPRMVGMDVGMGAGELARIVVGVAAAGLPVSQPATAGAARKESAAASKNRRDRGKFNLEMLLSESVRCAQGGPIRARSHTLCKL